jgi:two-component system chemotaxis response regulator CheB
MLAQQDETLEEALWVALKTLEESASLTQRMLKQANQRGHNWLVHHLEGKLQKTEQHIELLKSVLQKNEASTSTEASA